MEQAQISDSNLNFVKSFEKYDLGLHGLRMPVFDIDEKHKTKLNLSTSASNFEFLRELAREGFKKLNLPKGSELQKTIS